MSDSSQICVHCGGVLNAGARLCTHCNRYQNSALLAQILENPWTSLLKFIVVGLFLGIGGKYYQELSSEHDARNAQASIFVNSMIEIQKFAEMFQHPCPSSDVNDCERLFEQNFAEFGLLAYRFKVSARALLANLDPDAWVMGAIEFADDFYNPSNLEAYKSVLPLQVQLLRSRDLLTQPRERARKEWCSFEGRTRLRALTASIDTYRFCYGAVRKYIEGTLSESLFDGQSGWKESSMDGGMHICSGYMDSLEYIVPLSDRAELIYSLVTGIELDKYTAPWHINTLCGNEPEALGVIPADSNQLVAVMTDEWSSDIGQLVRFERSEDGMWRQAEPPIEVYVAEKGLAWGRGLHPFNWKTQGDEKDKEWRVKKEGDKRAPAGLFRLTEVFYDPAVYTESQTSFGSAIATHANLFCEDRIGNSAYNTPVELNETAQEKCGEEKNCPESMFRDDGAYDSLVWVEHNAKQSQGSGSCIFLHIENGRSTVGCTSMKRDSFESLLTWLKKEQNPVLLQLPRPEYTRRKQAWQLPNVLDSL